MNSRLTHPLFGAESTSQQWYDDVHNDVGAEGARIAANRPRFLRPVDDDSTHPVEQQRAGDHQRRQRQDGRRCGKVTGAKRRAAVTIAVHTTTGR